jgi:hypothetical protein
MLSTSRPHRASIEADDIAMPPLQKYGDTMKHFALVALLLILPTATDAKHVYPKHLRPIVQGVSYTLEEPYVFKEKAATFTLSAGVYVQKYADTKAIYLIGSKDCLEFNVVPPKNPAAAWTDRWDCGIYLPKNPAKGAAFFMIRRTPEERVRSGSGPIIDAIIKAGYGSFDFPTSKHNDTLLRSKLVAAP